MLVRRLLPVLLLLAFPTLANAAPPVSVLIVGSYHMNNPGHDYSDAHSDDVLAPKRQAELRATVDGLARFHPTAVDLEWSAKGAKKHYAEYLKGTMKPSRSEDVQIGFRLAKQSGATVHGIDEMMDFPFPPVQAYAKKHGMTAIVDDALAAIKAETTFEQHLIDTKSIPEILRWMNRPAIIRGDNDFYATMLNVGGGTDQPGADLVATWNRRNLHICANLVQHAKPGDRIVVIYGAGHAYRLRRCVSEMPGYKLVEANDYLPK